MATYAAPFSRDGPGLLLRDILKGDDAQLVAGMARIVAVSPDILVLTAFDHDADLVALRAFAHTLARAGPEYPHVFSLPSNAGLSSGLDLDGNGRRGEARDAQGYGRFAGQGGLAVLSRWPLELVADYSAVLWQDLPFATLPVTEDGGPFPSAAARDVQRLSSTGHWHLAVAHPDGRFDLLVWSATPPVFDGDEDLNGLRNRDELLLWDHVLQGWPPDRPFVIAGNANLDPFDGQGLRQAMTAFLADPRLQDTSPAQTDVPLPRHPDQRGPPALANAYWPDIGALRVSYVLPSRGFAVLGSGVHVAVTEDSRDAAAEGDGGHASDATDGGDSGPMSFNEYADAAGPHHVVWVDLAGVPDGYVPEAKGD